MASLGLDFRGEHVRLSADLGYQYQYIGGVLPYLGVVAGFRALGAERPQELRPTLELPSIARISSASSEAEVDLTERITAYAAFGVHDSRLGAFSGGAIVTVTNFNGNATRRRPTAPLHST